MARQKKLTPEQEKEIKILQANNEMLAKTKEEARVRGNADSVKRIETAQEEVLAQMAKIDANAAKKAKQEIKENNEKQENDNVPIQVNVVQDNETVFDKIAKAQNQVTVNTPLNTDITDEDAEEEYTPVLNINENIFSEIPNDVQYDIISLPSNGEGYTNKIGRIPVGYLTAYDENFLTSPNLYQDGLVIDYLLKNKILDKEFNVDKMYNGDADAVVLFLRATSYGAEFPITVRDPETGEKFDTIVDLTQFKSKPFSLHGDENGYFDYTLPLSKDKVKFKFLTRREEKNLALVARIEQANGRGLVIREAERSLRMALASEHILDANEIKELKEAIAKLPKWAEKVDDDKTVSISKLITNRLEMNIVSINGETDKKFISQYIRNMKVKDAFALRKYIVANEPGINWEFECQRPQSLGGGSFKTFLNWDDTVFFNIAQDGAIS